MTLKSFRRNNFGLSLLYDTVLFLVMVSLSGVMLLPAFQSNIAREGSLDAHRETVVDDALRTFLMTRPDVFSYRFCGSLIDDVAGNLGIDNSSQGLYGCLTAWLLAHEQRHKTYATLLAEKLGCEFHLPFSVLSTNRLNIFTGDYDRRLKNETASFFSSLFGDKYHYNLSAWWHPIKGVSFGGEFFIGEPPPTKDCYVARSLIMMPYKPILTIGNHTFFFTKQWLKHQLFYNDVGFGRSSIPAVDNLSIIFENYTKQNPPFNSKEYAQRATEENLSTLVYGFLIYGIKNESNMTVFPGIVNITLLRGFETIRSTALQGLTRALNESFGETIRMIDRLFGSLNTSIQDPLFQSILGQLNGTLQELLNQSFESLDEAFTACEAMIEEYITTLLNGVIDPLIETFVENLFDVLDTIIDFTETIIDWLFSRICLDKAEVMLTIWVVRE